MLSFSPSDNPKHGLVQARTAPSPPWNGGEGRGVTHQNAPVPPRRFLLSCRRFPVILRCVARYKIIVGGGTARAVPGMASAGVPRRAGAGMALRPPRHRL